MGNRRNETQVEALMKCFDATKPKYTTLFKIIALMINFLHKKCWSPWKANAECIVLEMWCKLFSILHLELVEWPIACPEYK
jgi:hypothetical protein